MSVKGRFSNEKEKMMIKMRGGVIEMTSFSRTESSEKSLRQLESQSKQPETFRFFFVSCENTTQPSLAKNVIKVTPESASFSFMVHNECSIYIFCISSEAIKSSFIHTMLLCHAERSM